MINNINQSTSIMRFINKIMQNFWGLPPTNKKIKFSVAHMFSFDEWKICEQKIFWNLNKVIPILTKQTNTEKNKKEETK